MSREGEYLVFATEQYRFAKGLSGAEVIELFKRHGVSEYIMRMFELFHIESEQNMIDAVDQFIAQSAVGDETAGVQSAGVQECRSAE